MNTRSGIHKTRLAILTAIFLMALASSSWAATYYVATNGNNSSNGSQATPWASLSYACGKAQSGDTINIAAGTYTDNNGCTLGTGVNIAGAGPDKTTIKSSYGDWYISGVSTPIVNGNQTISGFTLDGNSHALAHGIHILGRSNVTITNMNFVNVNDTAIQMQGYDWWTNADPDNNQASLPPGWATNCTISNVKTTSCSLKPMQASIWITTLKDSTVDNVYIDESAANGGRGNAIKSWPGFLNHTVVKNSTFIVDPNNSEPITMEFWEWMNDCEVANNTFKGGILSLVAGKASGGTYALKFHDNVVDGTNVKGAGHELALSDLDFYNNYVYNFGLSVWIAGHGWNAGGVGMSNIRIRNNVIKNGAPYGIYVTAGTPDAGNISNLQIYNNVIDSAAGTWGSKDGMNIAGQNGATVSGLKIQNNILQNLNNAVVLGSGVTSPVVTNNDFYSAGGVTGASGGTVSNNMSVAPQFVGTGTTTKSIYSLSSSSPVIDKGVNVGLPYTGSAPDMGAYEYGSATATITPPSNLHLQ